MGTDLQRKDTEAAPYTGSERHGSLTPESASPDGMLDYGRCVGIVKGDKVMVRPHLYSDGSPHYPNSDGLCPDCFRVSEAIRAQRKISRLEETLNREKTLPENLTRKS